MTQTRSDVTQSVPRVVLDPLADQEDGDVQHGEAAEARRTIRHAHLYLTRIDPWSVMKNAFMLSVAIAIVLVVATMVLWGLLTASGSLAALTRTVDDIAGSGANAVDLTGMLSFGHVLSITLVVAVMEVILLSALATLFAYMYNLAVGITGGLQVTLTEDN
jgi:Transmembrane domain of unknown function (DUF3566)